MKDGLSQVPVAFAPEAHLPPERRLVVDASGVTLETSLGVRHVLPWTACRAVLIWSDRAELLLDDQVSIVIRAADWHRGKEALDAIRERAPDVAFVPMPDDPEPEPLRYMLRGLATVSSAVLILLSLSLALVATIGIGIGEQNHRTSAVVVGVAFAVAAIAALRALTIRLQVPGRWRDAAAVRGRSAVLLDSRIATASDRALALAEPVLYALAGLLMGLVMTVHNFNRLPVVLVGGVGLAVRRERTRRARRRTGSSAS